MVTLTHAALLRCLAGIRELSTRVSTRALGIIKSPFRNQILLVLTSLLAPVSMLPPFSRVPPLLC